MGRKRSSQPRATPRGFLQPAPPIEDPEESKRTLCRTCGQPGCRGLHGDEEHAQQAPAAEAPPATPPTKGEKE